MRLRKKKAEREPEREEEVKPKTLKLRFPQVNLKRGFSLLHPRRLKQLLLSRFKRWMKVPKSSLPQISLRMKKFSLQDTKQFLLSRYEKREITKVLILVIVLLIFWLVIEVLTPYHRFTREEVIFRGAYGYPLLSSKTKTFSEYKRVFKSRKLFKPPMGISAEVAGLGVEKMAENLSLIGIVSMGNEFRAFVTNKKEGSTSLYKEGSKVLGFTIKEIAENKVKIEYAGQTIELTK